MTLCNLVLTPIVGILHVLVAVLRQIVETVCGWVTRTIRVIREVAERVCRRLPWPLSVLCGWVRRLIEVLENVTEWICENVLKTFAEFVEQVVEYIIFVLKWVCWLVDWIAFRWLAYLVCRAGIELPRCIPLCLTILTDARGRPTFSAAQAEQMVRDSNALLRQCNITLVVGSICFVEKPDLIENVPTGAGQLFSRAFAWFNRNVCDCCNGVTVYFIRSLDSGARGHAIPGSNYVLVAVDFLADNATLVHEIGHLADLWRHDDEVGNVMSLFSGTSRTRLRPSQCCLIGSARFARLCHC